MCSHHRSHLNDSFCDICIYICYEKNYYIPNNFKRVSEINFIYLFNLMNLKLIFIYYKCIFISFAECVDIIGWELGCNSRALNTHKWPKSLLHTITYDYMGREILFNFGHFELLRRAKSDFSKHTEQLNFNI